MKCEQFEHRLNEAFDERSALSDQVDLRGHAEKCATCNATLAAAMLVEEACQVAGERHSADSLPGDFSNRVVQEYLNVPVELAHRQKNRPRVSLILVASIAGMLLLALLPVFVWMASPKTPFGSDQISKVEPGKSARLPGFPTERFERREERTVSFLGPPPFGTGGNLALALTIMPLPEQIGLNGLAPQAIPGVDQIADSIQRVVRIIRWTLPPFPFQRL